MQGQSRLMRARKLWRRLIEPNQPIADEDRYQKTRLMASLLLAILVLVMPLVLVLIAASSDAPFLGSAGSLTWAVATLSSLISYGLCRRGHVRTATWLIIGIGIVTIFWGAANAGLGAGLQTLNYLIVLVILVSLFLPPSAIIGLTILNLALVLLYANLFADVNMRVLVNEPFTFLVTASLFVLLVNVHRTRLDRARRLQIAAGELRYRTITENVDDIILEADANFIIRYVSPSFRKLTDHPEAFIDQPISILLDYIHPEDQARKLATIEAATQTLQSARYDYRHRHPDGHYIWLEVSLTFLVQNGQMKGFVTISRDVTERREMESRLRLNEERTRQILESISDHIYSYRVGERSTLSQMFFSDRIEQLVGYSAEYFMGKTNRWSELLHADDQARARAQFEMLQAGDNSEVEYRLIHRDGSIVWVRDSAQVETRPDNGGVWVFGVVSDVTERKQAEAALKQSEQRYRVISEMMSDYAFSTCVLPDESLQMEWVTDSVERVTGFTVAEFKERPLFQLLHPDDAHMPHEQIAAVLRGETVAGKYRIFTKTGELRWLHVRRQPVRDDDTQPVVRFFGVVQDITGQMQAEQDLEEAQERLRTVVNHLPIVVLALDVDGVVMVCEGEGLEAQGIIAADLVGRSVFELAHFRLGTMAEVRQALTGQIMTTYYERDGAVFETTFRPIHNPTTGGLTGVSAVCADVTDRKASEKEMMAVALERERFAIIGGFVHDLSHDLRTPLALVGTSVDLMRRKLDPSHRELVDRHLDTIEQQVQHLDKQLDNLLHASKLDKSVQMHTFVLYDINKLVDHVLAAQADALAAKAHQVHLQVADGLPTIFADVKELFRAVEHLIVNAISYTPPGGAITVETRLDKNNDALLLVSDNGVGIAEEDLTRIFEPLYRADSARQVDSGGVGLGLSVVKMVVEAHGGHVSVTSTPGVGSTFTISLPPAPSELA
jgi:PAS domain S-box-containing protein